MTLAHKIALDLNDVQATHFRRDAVLQRQLNAIKGDAFPLMLVVTKMHPKWLSCFGEFRRVVAAFADWCRRCSAGEKAVAWRS
ncbi:MAG: hypothetical protein M1596_03480 [Firmicutes bacterium]|nr:hypothetical protein [Bacillota bacterium]